jgi:hypothetical protein
VAFDTEDLEQHLVAYLKADAALALLVSTRIYPDAAPAGALRPYVTYFRVDTIRDGRRLETGIDPMPHPRIQLDVYAATRKASRAVAKRLRQLLDGFRGTMATGTGVQFVKIEDEADSYEPPVASGDVGDYRVSMDAVFWHNE